MFAVLLMQCICMSHAHITGWVDCPPLCSTGGTWGCCGALAWGKGGPRTERRGH